MPQKVPAPFPPSNWALRTCNTLGQSVSRAHQIHGTGPSSRTTGEQCIPDEIVDGVPSESLLNDGVSFRQLPASIEIIDQVLGHVPLGDPAVLMAITEFDQELPLLGPIPLACF